MSFKSSKFECIRYWSDPLQAPNFNYVAPDNTPIEVKSNLRDLGVQLSDNLSFKLHIENVVASASRLVGWGLRTFRGRGRKVMLTLLKSIVQPKLDYCSQLWGPPEGPLLDSLGKNQWDFTRLIQNANTWITLII